MLMRLGAGIVLSMLVMGFSLPLYSGEVYGESAYASGSVAELLGFLRYACLLLTTVVFLLLGLPILSSALDRLSERTLTSDGLIVLGVAAAILYSYYATLTGTGGTYFETTCMVLVLFTLGRYLEAVARSRASQALQSLEDRLPGEIEVTRDGVCAMLRTSLLRVGDLVHVPAGTAIPVDGVVRSGQAHVNAQSVTGESHPLFRSAGDRVEAGTLNLDGLIDVEATAVGSESTLGRLASLLEQARRRKGRYQRAADRVAAWFVPVVLVLAGATAWGHIRAGRVETAILASLSVLLISCPCALGIATPAAVWIALGRAARRGVWIKGGEALETLARIRAVAFDKTGTLTQRSPRVTAHPNGASGTVHEGNWLSLAAGLARATRHVYGDAILNFAQSHGATASVVDEARTLPGAGVEGRADGQAVFLGSITAARERKARCDDQLSAQARRIQDVGDALSCLIVDQQVRVLFSFRDQVRSEATVAVTDLRRMGCMLCIVSGDHAERARVVAEELNIPVLAALRPADKVRAVTELRKCGGPAAMVGDGLNDAPALAGADVGLAMGCGADLARDAADVCFSSDDLTLVPWSIALARRAVRTIRFNLAWAFAFNAVGIPLAMTGCLSPIFAAVVMVLGSVTVVANATRLERFDSVSG